MSTQHLKLAKNSQSTGVPALSSNNLYCDAKHATEPGAYQDMAESKSGATGHQIPKGSKSGGEMQTFQKKLQRRDLNLIPPSATIAQIDPYASGNDYGGNGGSSKERSLVRLTLNSTQNKNRSNAVWDSINPAQHSRVTTVKHEKGLPNGTIMQCLKQFQRSKQQRTQGSTNLQAQNHDPSSVSKPTISLQSVTPITSQNVANMPISTKSNKSQKSAKTRAQIVNNASMAADAHAQRRQNFTCTTTKGSLRLTKKSPSNGREQPATSVSNQTRQQRDRSANMKHSTGGQNYQTQKNARGSNSQQHNGQDKPSRQGQKPSSKKQVHQGSLNKQLQSLSEFEQKFSMLMRIHEEHSCESGVETAGADSQPMIQIMKGANPNDAAMKLISPSTTTNRQKEQDTKLLSLKNFQPAKQNNSNVVTPKYLKCKPGQEKPNNFATSLKTGAVHDKKQMKIFDDSSEVRNSKVQSKSQISTHKVQKGREQTVYGTVGTSPESKGAQSRIEPNTSQSQAKSLSNNSRQKYTTHQTIRISDKQGREKDADKGQKIPQLKNSNNEINAMLKAITGMNSQAQQPAPVQSSNSALNGSSELQKRFTRGDIGSHHEASVSSGKANKSFQFGHNTALMSCSSGGDSSNAPQPVRRRSSSGKQGKQQIKIAQMQNVHPVVTTNHIPGTTTSASISNLNPTFKLSKKPQIDTEGVSRERPNDSSSNQNDNSYLNLRKHVPQSTTNNGSKSGKRFNFALGVRSSDHNTATSQQKASRPNKHVSQHASESSSIAFKQTVSLKHGQKPAGGGSQAPPGGNQLTQPSQQMLLNLRDPSMGNNNASKSATKGKSVSAKKGKHVKASGANGDQASNEKATGQSAATTSKHAVRQVTHKIKTPDQMLHNDLPQQKLFNKTDKTGAKEGVSSATNSVPQHSQHSKEATSKASTGISAAHQKMMKERAMKQSHDSTPNSSLLLASSFRDSNNTGSELVNLHGKQKSRKAVKPEYSESNTDLLQHKDSIMNDSQVTDQTHNFGHPETVEQDSQNMSSQVEMVPSATQATSNLKVSGDAFQVKQMEEELQMRDNLIRQLQLALGRKDEQLDALTKNCEVLTSNLKARDEKRDRSQQAIKETLKNLEQKLAMFTAQSEHNQGGLRQITQSPYEEQRLKKLTQGSYQDSGQMKQYSTTTGVITALNAPPSSTAQFQMQSESRGAHTTQFGAGAAQAQMSSSNEATRTPTLSNKRIEPLKMNFQNSGNGATKTQQRPTSSAQLTVPGAQMASGGQRREHGSAQMSTEQRRQSQVSEIDSLVTVAEYLGTQYYDGATRHESQFGDDILWSATKKDQLLPGEPTIGSLASDIQIINSQKPNDGFPNEKVNFPPVFMKTQDDDDLAEMTSLSEMEVSNVHDASLYQLERDLMDTQQKLQEQTHKAVAFVQAQKNNFMDLKASLGVQSQKQVIEEDTEEAEDDVAQILPGNRPQNQFHQTQMFQLQDAGLSSNQRNLVSKNEVELAAGALNSVDKLKENASAALDPQSAIFKSMSQIKNNNQKGGTYNISNKMTKTLSKNKMKLKLANEILGIKKDQINQETVKTAADERLQEKNENLDRSTSKEGNTKTMIRKKIQLPLKMGKTSQDSKKIVLQSKSQERGTLSNNTTSGQSNPVFNSVTIRNIKASTKGDENAQRNSVQRQTQLQMTNQNYLNLQQRFPAKSPQSRQGVSIQGQGKMLSNRLNHLKSGTTTSKSPQSSNQVPAKIDANAAHNSKLLAISKLQGQSKKTDYNGLLPTEDRHSFEEERKAVQRRH